MRGGLAVDRMHAIVSTTHTVMGLPERQYLTRYRFLVIHSVIREEVLAFLVSHNSA